VKSKVLIPYTTPLANAGAVRKVAVAMHFAALNGLGFVYKCVPPPPPLVALARLPS
jgi:hypothetical protein